MEILQSGEVESLKDLENEKICKVWENKKLANSRRHRRYVIAT